MTGATGSLQATPPDRRSEQDRRRDELIFWSDLNEVYLLLDFVSGRPDLNFDQLTMQNPLVPDEQWTSGRILYEISSIRYPPPPGRDIDAKEAATVLVAKDRLSRAVAPARGETIAYTALFAATGAGYRQAKGRNSDPRRSPADAAAAAPEEKDAVIRVARETFPHLERHARRFRHLRTILIFGALIILLLTALTSWDVAFGRATLQRVDQLTRDRDALIQANPQLLKYDTCPNFNPESNPSPTLPDPQNPAGWTDGKNASGCFQLWYLNKRFQDALLDLKRLFRCASPSCNPYIHVFHWGLVLCGESDADDGATAPTKTGDKEGATPGNAPGTTSTTKPVSWQTATTVVMVFTTYILPILFGLLGTAIGALRSIQNKVRDGELGPRDFGLTLLGLPLGATAGLVVGLFFSPSTAPIQGAGGVAGDLSLTASGLGFLAGFGCQSFFKFLEELLGRAFPEGGPTLGSTTPPTSTRR